MKQLLLGVLLLATAYSTLAGDCKQLTFTQLGGKPQVYNLEPLSNLGTLGASQTIQGVTYNFQFTICAPLSLPGGCPNFDDTNHSACYAAPVTPGGPLLRNNPAVCMTYPVTTHQQPPVASFGTNCLGQYSTSGATAFQASVITTSTGGVSLLYGHGDQPEELPQAYHTIVNVLCDKKVVGTPTISVSWALGSPQAVFTVQHAAGCPTHKKGLSGGSICLIILTVALVVYLVGGCLYNHFLKGRSGTDMIPNHTFWGNLPGLVVDGVRFIICRPPLGGAKDYERVEG